VGEGEREREMDVMNKRKNDSMLKNTNSQKSKEIVRNKEDKANK
jgi:hypothetical protein